MFLACTGPTPVGIWRVSDDAIAIRDSVNRAKGTGYQKDVTMKKTKYLQMMEEQVFVALADAYPNATKIIVQQDGARPHTGNTKDGEEPTTEELNEIAAHFRSIWPGCPPIEVITQPAQSPDFNINDLAFFRSLGTAVRKLRRGTVDFDKEKLAADVKKAWDDYDQSKLDDMWEYHAHCLRASLDTTPPGGNDYDRHMRAAAKRARKL